ncbi:copper chaperone PCu(A)C [Gemmobacter serpentinus]|uniref:copper chaperone PCu(A)C n=1 Tax=Gemmobacter serpentinus TaxID=2652247 RepID=UPI001CF6799D|nr:copper chaperone PCu(A)C [Gemmobacter serpentinus]
MKLTPILTVALLGLAAAPALAEQAGHSPDHTMPAHEAASVTQGDLTLTGGFTRATLPGAPVAGGFVTITNAGNADDVLTGGQATFAAEVQVHEMAMEGDVMKMRHLPDGLPIPAGSSIDLKPGSFHLMFMGLKQPLTEGETVTVDLTFEKAGTVTLPLAVMGPGAKSADHSAH